MLTNFHIWGCGMSIKIHYLFCHLDKFRENHVDVSAEQDEWFHKDIKSMDERYLGRRDRCILVDNS